MSLAISAHDPSQQLFVIQTIQGVRHLPLDFILSASLKTDRSIKFFFKNDDKRYYEFSDSAAAKSTLQKLCELSDDKFRQVTGDRVFNRHFIQEITLKKGFFKKGIHVVHGKRISKTYSYSSAVIQEAYRELEALIPFKDAE